MFLQKVGSLQVLQKVIVAAGVHTEYKDRYSVELFFKKP